MANSNARLIEKDIFEDLEPAVPGDSEVLDLWKQCGGPDRMSVQAIYDVLSFDAAVEDSASDIFDEEDPDHPSQFFKADHGFVTGLKVQIATSDTLPDPLQVTTDYFIIVIDSDYYQLAETLDDALAGTQIDLVDVGVGNQTVTAVALAGATVTFQESNDGVNWTNVQSATSITVDGSTVLKQIVYLRYFKAAKAITAGAVDLKALTLVIGDA